MDSQKISECMKRNMEKNNITAEILSEKTGLSLSRIEEYMSGEFVPKAFELKLIAQEVGVPLISLIHGGGWIEYYMKDETEKTFVNGKNTNCRNRSGFVKGCFSFCVIIS